MANYPQLDDCSGVWKLKDVNDAVMGAYWRVLSGTVGRALNAGGFTPAYSNVIEQFQIETSGNSTDFGDLSVARGEMGAIGTPTRMVFLAGNAPAGGDKMDYVTIATTGNAAGFGDFSSGTTQRSTGVGGNAVRGVFTEGTVDINGMDYITPTTLGNSITFGDMTVSGSFRSGVTSPTRVCFAEGFTPSVSNVIDFIEIATTGNTVDFGDLTSARRAGSGLSSSTRGVFAGGITPSALSGLEFITIASQGNAVDYGDLLTSNNKECDSTSNSVRGIVAGGHPAQNVIQQFNIATGGDTTDFGDLLSAVNSCALNSGSHGGLNEGYLGTKFTYFPIGKPVPRGGGVGDLSVKVGGEGSSAVALIGFNLISTAGNENFFGDLTNGARYDTNGCAGDTRMFTWSGTLDGTGGVNSIDYLTFSHKGNTADFGDATETRQVAGCLANSTRALGAGGGTPSNSNVIDFITIATIGNASDFGDLTAARKGPGGLASTTRGVFGGGTGLSNVMEYVTISSAGNGTDFGDLTQARRSPGAASSSTRGVFAGGRRVDSPIAESDVIDYITIASTGNAQDFGDLTQNRAFLDGTSNSTRAIFTGGYSGSNRDEIDFVTIASTGNAADFGDLMVAARGAASGSNGHGGLS